MKISPIIYTVRGTGPFPIDMLREDGSSPYSVQDSERMDYSISLKLGDSTIFQVTLIKHNGYHHWTPNSIKWKAYGWEVINVEERKP